MQYPVSEYPPFSWSFSKDELFRRCARAYYLSTYLKWRGWERGAPLIARRAYVCSKLTSLPLVVGQSVHAAARQCVVASLERRPRPSMRALQALVSDQLNAVYRASKYGRQAFLARPSSVPMLQEFFYRDGLTPATISATRSRIERCLTALLNSSVLDELRTCTQIDARVLDDVQSFCWRGITIYAAPDLVFRPRIGAGDEWHILDWKTGASRRVADQLLVYALLARNGLALPMGSGFICRCVSLGEAATLAFVADAADIVKIELHIAASVADMRALLRTEEVNEPLPMDAFEPRPSPNCARCNFRGICAEGQSFTRSATRAGPA